MARRRSSGASRQPNQARFMSSSQGATCGADEASACTAPPTCTRPTPPAAKGSRSPRSPAPCSTSRRRRRPDNSSERSRKPRSATHLSDHSLDEQFKRYPHHPGVKALKQATLTDPTLTRSEAERNLVDLIRKAGLPPPETNTRIAGHEVDAVWRARRLVVEVDGYAYHGTRAAFERDRRRDADLQAAGFRVLRITWRRLQDEPLAVAAALGVLLTDVLNAADGRSAAGG